MKVLISNVVDKNYFSEENSYKVYLMDKIIEQLLPVFCFNVERKKNQLNDNLEDENKLKNDILQIKSKLKIFLKKIEKEELKKNILTEIQLLVKKDLLYGRNKQIVKDVLISFDSEENLKDKLMIIKSI
jgi:hypothetical protein